jgi:preprotein translocase subunit SecD
VDIPGLGSFDAPLVQGFAVTLAFGVVISMFSALTVTRTLLHLFVGTRFATPEWMGTDVRTEPAPAAGDES